MSAPESIEPPVKIAPTRPRSRHQCSCPQSWTNSCQYQTHPFPDGLYRVPRWDIEPKDSTVPVYAMIDLVMLALFPTSNPGALLHHANNSLQLEVHHQNQEMNSKCIQMRCSYGKWETIPGSTWGAPMKHFCRFLLALPARRRPESQWQEHRYDFLVYTFMIAPAMNNHAKAVPCHEKCEGYMRYVFKPLDIMIIWFQH